MWTAEYKVFLWTQQLLNVGHNLFGLTIRVNPWLGIPVVGISFFKADTNKSTRL